MKKSISAYKSNSVFFRIPKNKNIPNTPSRCLNFSFSVECLFNFDFLRDTIRESQETVLFRIFFLYCIKIPDLKMEKIKHEIMKKYIAMTFY